MEKHAFQLLYSSRQLLRVMTQLEQQGIIQNVAKENISAKISSIHQLFSKKRHNKSMTSIVFCY